MTEGKRSLLDRITNRDVIQDQAKRLADVGEALKTASDSLVKLRTDFDSAMIGPMSRMPSTTKAPEFGEGITDQQRLEFSQREPVINWLVNKVSEDIFDNWFKVVDLDHEDKDDLDKEVQPVLEKLNAKREMTRLTVFERRYGTAILLLSYTMNNKETWRDSIRDKDGKFKGTAQILQISPKPKTRFALSETDKDPSSPRYGLPEIYKVQIGGTETEVHWSRVIHMATRLDEDPVMGTSVIDITMDDAAGYRKMRWGIYHAFYRYGHGFPWIDIPTATRDQIDTWIVSGEFSNIFNRRYFVSGKARETIRFVGAEGSVMNPVPYMEAALENLSMATGIPKDILRGASAGAITGSEVNERNYFKRISSEQSLIDPTVRELIDRLIETGQIKFDGKYRNKWESAFELNEKDRTLIKQAEAQTHVAELQYKTVNEVRKAVGLNELGPEGNVVLSLIQPQAQGPPMDETKEEEKELETQTKEKMDQIRQMLINDLEEIMRKAEDGEITEEEALSQAETIISDQVREVSKATREELQARTGKTIPEDAPEDEARYGEMVKEYLGLFKLQLKDRMNK